MSVFKSRGVFLLLFAVGSTYGQESGRARSSPIAAGEEALMEDLPVVQAAALHRQTLQEAPADVTIISAEEIRKYGYRTLGEALNSVRGFYQSYDRIYHYMGLSGVSLPGDYNSRFLVLIDGHSMTEHIFGSNNFFGQDFGLDMDLVERIEIIRGPASALYGSNAMLATINILTRSPVDVPGFRASSETGTMGERKAWFSDSLYLGKGANLLVSGSYFLNSGQTLYIQQFDSPDSNHGVVTNGDGEQGYHAFANLIWRDWNFTAYFNTRRKRTPVNWAPDTVFDDGGSRVRDGRNFVEAARSQEIGISGKLRYRFYYDDYRYDDRFDYTINRADGTYVQDWRTLSRAEWAGSEITWSMADTSRGALTLGAQAELEFRNLTQQYNMPPASGISQSRAYSVDFDVPDRNIAFFSQQEWRFSRKLTAYAGLRFDRSHNYSTALSPRLALVYQQSPRTVFKAVYGRPFRDASAFEKYFDDNLNLIANPNIRSEHSNTLELTAEERFSRKVTGLLNLYQYRIDDLIQEVFPGDGSAPQYQNVTRARSIGAETEVAITLSHEMELRGSITLQRTVDTTSGLMFANSPRILGKVRAGSGIFHNRMFIASSVQLMSSRVTIANATVARTVLQDLTFTTRRSLFAGFALQAGIRNLWNTRFDDPVGLAIDAIQQNGRTAYLKLMWNKVQ